MRLIRSKVAFLNFMSNILHYPHNSMFTQNYRSARLTDLVFPNPYVRESSFFARLLLSGPQLTTKQQAHLHILAGPMDATGANPI